MSLRPSPRAQAVVAAFLVVVAGCSPAASLGPSPTSGASPTAGAPATASSSVVPTAVAGWQRSPDQPAFEDAFLTGVIWTGERFVATTRGEPVLFDSVDGTTWHRQPPFETTARSSGPDLVAAGPDGVIAIGGGSNVELVIWQSADGLTWSSVPHQDAFDSRDGAFQDVHGALGSDRGWIAVGSEFYNCVPRCPLRGMVLTSNDGAQWTRLAEQPALRYAEMHAVVREASGFVAAGARMIDPKNGQADLGAALWTSPDGRDWTSVGQASTFVRPELPGWTGPTDVVVRSVAVIGDRLVLLGDIRPSSGSSPAEYVPPVAIAWSLVGATWTPVTIGAFDDESPLSLIAVPDGLLAITGTGSACPSGLWASEDGTAWRCAGTDTTFDGYVVTGAAVSADLEVLVGRSLTDPVVGAVWTRTIR